MKTTITFSTFCDAFRDMGREDQFSYDAKRALFDYLDDTFDGEYELDVIALCCEFVESDLHSVISDYSIDVSEAADDDEKVEMVQEYIRDNTPLVARIGTDFVFAQF